MVYSIYQALTMKSENTVFQTYISRDDTKASDLEFGKWCGEKSMEPCGGRPCDVRTLCACLRSLEAASWFAPCLQLFWCQDVPGTTQSLRRMPKVLFLQTVPLHFGWSSIWHDFEISLTSHQNSRPISDRDSAAGESFQLELSFASLVSGFDRHVPPLAPTCQRCWSSSRGRCWDPSFVILSGSNLVPLRLGPQKLQ